jgi:hypothetical protein
MATLDECYAVLGVPAYAPRADVSAKYRLLIQVWHPDRFEHQPALRGQAEEHMKQITAAYKQIEAAGFPERTEATRHAPVRPPAPPATAACPWCGVVNRLPGDYAGEAVTCGACRATFRVSGRGDARREGPSPQARRDMTPSHVRCPSCAASNWCLPEEMVACVSCGGFFSWS